MWQVVQEVILQLGLQQKFFNNNFLCAATTFKAIFTSKCGFTGMMIMQTQNL